MDFSTLEGSQVRSVTVGRVTEVAENEHTGKFIRIYNSSTNIESTYIHLQSQDITVGTDVVPGTPIAKSGASVNSDGVRQPHLHLQFLDFQGGTVTRPNASPINPLSKLGSDC
jgi:murein DD-endopeptidase MepM/ murein hydrolase activator NlpD